MTEQQSSPSTTSQIGGIRAHTNFQAIDATFFNLTDTEGRATAGLLVLLDRMHRPVRAELHFYEEIDGFMRDNTVRQAQLLLQDRYYSREPVVLRVMYVFQDRNAYDVALPQPDGATLGPQQKTTNWKKIAAVVAAIALGIALVWAVSRMIGGSSSSSDAQTSAEATVAAETVAADEVVEGAVVEGEVVDGEVVAADAVVVEQEPVQSENLPESQNARNDLSVGMRAAILPGLQSYIRTEPDATIGENIGTFQDGDAGLLIDGPIYRPGASDTIVWWYIVSDNGDEGWVPANTSQFTLLVPEE